MSQSDLRTWFLSELFQQIPIKIAVIDRSLRIVQANSFFEETFGDWRNKSCYEIYKSRGSQCENCDAALAFEDGRTYVSQEQMTDRHGQSRHYLVHITPLRLDTGEIPYIIEMSTEITDLVQTQKEYQLLFDKAPCYITILDRDLHVITANERFRATFGDEESPFCYQKYKHQDKPCLNCPALQVFKDGKEHSATMIGRDKDDDDVHYMVTASPLVNGQGQVEHVMEIATDITVVRNLQVQLESALELQKVAIDSAFDGMIIAGSMGNIRIYNQGAEDILGYPLEEVVDMDGLRKILPGAFVEIVWDQHGACTLQDTTLTNKEGETVPVGLSGTILKNGDEIFGAAIYLHDLRALKQLQSEKLVAERLAAVGQTVAGLAHGIKNILTGLEGGLFVINSGIRKADVDRIQKGLSMLESNISRITHFVKEFLSFARGREPVVRMTDPNAVAREILELYTDAAAREKVEIQSELQDGIAPAPLDPEGIHTCLANLVSNAVDACLMSDRDSGLVILKTKEENGAIVFEVSDNGAGMDYEVKKKVFTSFFSTKGSHEGTGLGLLVTRKIIQEHGGSIDFDTAEGEGTTFRIVLPRERLPEPADETPEGQGQTP